MRKVLLALFVVSLFASMSFADEAKKFESKYMDVELTDNAINLYAFRSLRDSGAVLSSMPFIWTFLFLPQKNLCL